ncbi:Tn3 family transposase [Nonomuraea sp. NPDC049141]|uniref:Tn3 family transposase n=1 Tax=unclassified Nonomuraea TaxID=2593643 RepID=UPI0033DD78AE
MDRDAYVVCVLAALHRLKRRDIYASPRSAGPTRAPACRVEKMLPKTDLPDLLFEVHAWTRFLDAFVHLGDGRARVKDLTTTVVAMLMSEACNIGMTPVINPDYAALTRARMVHVDQYYLAPAL